MKTTLRVSPRSAVSCLISCFGISTLLTSSALAQVNGPGPSPANLFDTVLSVPGDEAIVGGVNQSIGQVEGQTTQLNVTDRGTVGQSFTAFFGSEVNISGGTVGHAFEAFAGSEVNISGGALGDRFTTFSDSQVDLLGGEFRLNGADWSGDAISLNEGDVFTGTLADGSSFIFSYAVFDRLTNVTLSSSVLPAADLSPMVISSPINSGPSGLRADQVLTLQAGGSLRDYFAVVDATLNVAGGVVGDSVEAHNSIVNIGGGNFGDSFATSGSVVNITDGIVGLHFAARSGSTVNITGGTVGRNFAAGFGSEVNISGGEVGNNSDSPVAK